MITAMDKVVLRGGVAVPACWSQIDGSSKLAMADGNVLLSSYFQYEDKSVNYVDKDIPNETMLLLYTRPTTHPKFDRESVMDFTCH